VYTIFRKTIHFSKKKGILGKTSGQNQTGSLHLGFRGCVSQVCTPYSWQQGALEAPATSDGIPGKHGVRVQRWISGLDSGLTVESEKWSTRTTLYTIIQIYKILLTNKI